MRRVRLPARPGPARLGAHFNEPIARRRDAADLGGDLLSLACSLAIVTAALALAARLWRITAAGRLPVRAGKQKATAKTRRGFNDADRNGRGAHARAPATVLRALPVDRLHVKFPFVSSRGGRHSSEKS